MKTVAIIEGFSGGPRLTHLLREELRSAGFTITKSKTNADVILAHSAGIYAIPQNTSAKLLVLIGPTYWPGRRLLKRVVDFATRGRRFYVKNYGLRFYIKKRALEIYYFFTRHKYMWLGILHNNRLDHIEKLASDPTRRIIIVRNKDESFTTPELNKVLTEFLNIKVVGLPGVHDIFYVEPQPYIKLIKDALR